MKTYTITYNVGGWIETKTVSATNAKEARRNARVSNIISVKLNK